jgi:hypothetical protein
VLLIPLVSWAAPANRNETRFLHPSLRRCAQRFGWVPRWTVGDMAYIDLPQQRRLREELHVAFVTRLRADMHLVAPYTAAAVPRCHQGQRLEWLGYEEASAQQWFGAAAPAETCLWCWEKATCPREFAFAAASHEILLGLVPHASWLAKHLTQKVRPWIEPAQSYEKNQLGLSAFFLNSLRLAWTMCLLADTAVLLRAHLLRRHPCALEPLGDLTPNQLVFEWSGS